MTNIDDAVARLRNAWDNAGRVPAYHYRAKAELHDTWPTLANAITDLLAAAPPRIIRTRDELAAADPDTLLFSTFDTVAFPAEEAQKRMARGRWIGIGWIPAVVIATGDQVRAARQALEEA